MSTAALTDIAPPGTACLKPSLRGKSLCPPQPLCALTAPSLGGVCVCAGVTVCVPPEESMEQNGQDLGLGSDLSLGVRGQPLALLVLRQVDPPLGLFSVL